LPSSTLPHDAVNLDKRRVGSLRGFADFRFTRDALGEDDLGAAPDFSGFLAIACKERTWARMLGIPAQSGVDHTIAKRGAFMDIEAAESLRRCHSSGWIGLRYWGSNAAPGQIALQQRGLASLVEFPCRNDATERVEQARLNA